MQSGISFQIKKDRLETFYFSFNMDNKWRISVQSITTFINPLQFTENERENNGGTFASFSGSRKANAAKQQPLHGLQNP
jgi:hypothetical protein